MLKPIVHRKCYRMRLSFDTIKFHIVEFVLCGFVSKNQSEVLRMPQWAKVGSIEFKLKVTERL